MHDSNEVGSLVTPTVLLRNGKVHWPFESDSNQWVTADAGAFRVLFLWGERREEQEVQQQKVG